MMPELRSEYSRHCLEMGKKVFGNKKIVKRITCIMVIVFGVLHTDYCEKEQIGICV